MFPGENAKYYYDPEQQKANLCWLETEMNDVVTENRK